MSGFHDEVARLDAAQRQQVARSAAAARSFANETEAVVPEVRRLLLDCAKYLNQSAATPQRIDLPGHKVWRPMRSPAGYALVNSGGGRGSGGRFIALLMPDGRFWRYDSGYIEVTAESIAGRQFVLGWGASICSHKGAPAVRTEGTAGDIDRYEPLAAWLAARARVLSGSAG